MITATKDYLELLWKIQSENPTSTAVVLPTDEKIYNIDLNTRKVEAPEFLGVEQDHYAETYFFAIDRYYDNMDLATTTCIIQYVNKNSKYENGTPKGGFAYLVPFYDLTYLKDQDKILIPWAVAGPATEAVGPVSFSFRFYNIIKEDEDNYRLVYNLTTLPANTKVLDTMDVTEEFDYNFSIGVDAYEQLSARINQLDAMSKFTLTWEIL